MSRTEHVNFLVIFATVVAFSARVMAGPVGLIAADSVSSDALALLYDPATGRLSAFAPESSPLTALEIRSQSEQISPPCDSFGVFDVCARGKLFHLDISSFETVDFGSVLPTGMTSSDLVEDLLVDGASVGGGFYVGSGPTLSLVPEPTSGLVMSLGATAVFGLYRRWRELH